MGAVLGGANLIYHAAGWLEGGLTASYEKLVLDVEILQNMMEFLRPLPFQEDDLGFEAIKSVPAGGHFFGAEHTMSRYTTAFYQPMLSNWQNYGAWQEAGGKDALERATDLWQQALHDYEEPVMDPDQMERGMHSAFPGRVGTTRERQVETGRGQESRASTRRRSCT